MTTTADTDDTNPRLAALEADVRNINVQLERVNTTPGGPPGTAGIPPGAAGGEPGHARRVPGGNPGSQRAHRPDQRRVPAELRPDQRQVS